MLGDHLGRQLRKGHAPLSASRTRAPTMPWASRKGTPLRTSRSAMSTAAILVSRGRGHPLAVERKPGEQAGRDLERDLERVDRVEQRLLVLLHVLRIGHRQRVQSAGNG